MLVEVSVRVTNPDGSPLWVYAHVEGIALPDPGDPIALAELSRECVQNHLETAASSVAVQSGVTLESLRREKEGR